MGSIAPTAPFLIIHPHTKTMNYQEQLNPWVIHQLLPDLTRSVIMRFRRRNDAECYLRVMNHIRPNVHFAIAFEVNNVIETVTPTPKDTSKTKKAASKTKKTSVTKTFVPM